MADAVAIARIRFEHFQNGKGFERIAREQGIACDTVRKVRVQGRQFRRQAHGSTTAQEKLMGRQADGDT